MSNQSISSIDGSNELLNSSISSGAALSQPVPSDSQVSRDSLGESQDVNRSFRKYPCLDEAFKHECWDDNGQRLAICRFCGIKYIGNRYKRLFDHAQDCEATDQNIKKRLAAHSKNLFAEKHKDLTNLRRNLKLTAFIIESGAQFAIVEYKTYKSFIADLNPAFKSAGRHDISSELLPLVSLQVEQKFLGLVHSMPDFSLSIEFDHWADLCHREFLGVIATRPDGKRFLFDLKDVSSEGKSANATIPVIQGILAKLPPMKINAIISDSAAPCKKARNILHMDFQYYHLFEYGCLAHLMHNCGKMMGRFEPIKSLLETANSISSYLSLDALFLVKLKNLGMARIKKACKTRWSSDVEMLESIDLVKHIAIEHLEEEKKNRRNKDRIQSDLDIMNESTFWDDLKQAVRIYRPVANCIAVIERADSCLSEAVRSIFDCAARLLTSDTSDRFTQIALHSLFSYFNEEKLGEFQYGLMFAAYFLDRRYKMDHVTDTGVEIVLKTLGQVACQSSLSGVSSIATEEALFSGFSQFCKQKGTLSRAATANMKPSSWWLAQPDDLGILKIVAIRIAHLKPSSANIERVFSILRSTQSLNRTNYNPETLTNLTRAKLWLLESGAIDDIDQLFDEQSPGEQENPLLRKLSSTQNEPNDNEELVDRISLTEGWTHIELPSDIQEHVTKFKSYIDYARVTQLRVETPCHQDSSDISDRLLLRLRAERSQSQGCSPSNSIDSNPNSETVHANLDPTEGSTFQNVSLVTDESDSLIDSIILGESVGDGITPSKTTSRRRPYVSSQSQNSSLSRQSSQSMESVQSREFTRRRGSAQETRGTPEQS